VVTVRSRRHVVIARLNEAEYEIYERILRKAMYGSKRFSRNSSERFRLALRIIDESLKREAMAHFYEHCLDF
jgi:hypothetical protein